GGSPSCANAGVEKRTPQAKAACARNVGTFRFIMFSSRFSIWVTLRRPGYPFESPSRFLPFLLNGLRRAVLSPLDPLRECGRVHERVWVARFAGLQQQAALQHAAAGIPAVFGPAMDLQVHLDTLYLRDL